MANILIVTGLLLLIGVSLLISRKALLTRLGCFLVVNDYEAPADAIFVLDGDVSTRPFHAHKLFEQGVAPLILVPQTEETAVVKLGLYPHSTDVVVKVMERLGVPSNSIVVLPFAQAGSASTHEEAMVLRRYLEQARLSRIILVTNPFHTRRAKWAFEKELRGLDVHLMLAATPYVNFDASTWWHHEVGFLTIFNEYVKLLYYFISR